jgi:hypothetical protein
MGIAHVRLYAPAGALALAIGCATEDRGVGFEPAWQPGATSPMPSTIGDDGDDDEGGTDDESDDGNASDESDAVDDAADDAADDGNDTAPPADDGMPPAEDGGDTGTGDPVLDACLDMATNECETCACNMCLDPLYACQQDVGCVAMRDCAEAAGCAGTECAEPCGAVIEMYGGFFGESATLALALSDCLEPACPICF